MRLAAQVFGCQPIWGACDETSLLDRQTEVTQFGSGNYVQLCERKYRESQSQHHCKHALEARIDKDISSFKVSVQNRRLTRVQKPKTLCNVAANLHDNLAAKVKSREVSRFLSSVEFRRCLEDAYPERCIVSLESKSCKDPYSIYSTEEQRSQLCESPEGRARDAT